MDVHIFTGFYLFYCVYTMYGTTRLVLFPPPPPPPPTYVMIIIGVGGYLKIKNPEKCK